MEPCLADAAPEAAPGLPFVKTRYAVARPNAAAVIAAGCPGGAMPNLRILRAVPSGSASLSCHLGDSKISIALSKFLSRIFSSLNCERSFGLKLGIRVGSKATTDFRQPWRRRSQIDQLLNWLRWPLHPK